ncbi:MAG: phosphopantothenoylcysteine decarboxylase [Clostridiales Family XIII bacterium]|jgi:phosphopantothenoylcysteine decarboxylase/phosphopantothenoylcysteine decarboxylase/phosphopantothenate--cysteine ligase|nr:phosphopantothenoylcysteine decarboxylase [Clostridiales Family XIII bacterium]
MGNILLGISGSIAAYKSADLANALTKEGHVVSVVMTKNACEFISPLTFETLTKQPVYTESFARNSGFDVEHIGLAKKANILVLAPATANLIGKIASGIADDLLTTTVMATKEKPILICPAMNTAMYENPIVQGNIEKLTSLGYLFAEPRESLLACGDLGKGALAEVETILQHIRRLL